MTAMSNAAHARILSVEEWAALPEDDSGELVDGILVEEEMPSVVHEVIVVWLVRVLGAWASAHGARLLGSGAKLAVDTRRGRLADASIYLQDARRPALHGVVTVPPSIVIEVVSPSPSDARRDRIEKVAEYARFGVRWYWIVDPQLRSFEILELDASGRYGHAIGVTDGTIASIPGCPELAIDVSELWRDVDTAVAEAGTGHS